MLYDTTRTVAEVIAEQQERHKQTTTPGDPVSPPELGGPVSEDQMAKLREMLANAKPFDEGVDE